MGGSEVYNGIYTCPEPEDRGPPTWRFFLTNGSLYFAFNIICIIIIKVIEKVF